MKMRRLIPTISMALLGASLLGTSTYAWFSANDKASAEGLSITARSASSLLISNDNSNWSSQTTLAAQKGYNKIVDPVTEGVASGTASTTALDFKKLDADSKKKVGADGSAPSDAVYVTADDSDVFKSPVYLKYQGKSSETVGVTATLTCDSTKKTDLWKAVRVVLTNKGKTTKVATFSFTKLGEATTETQFSIDQGVKDFDVYMWIEGSDTNCITNNSVDCGEYDVSFNFAISTAK